ncbi:ABC transporter substrate-binding protein [Aquamicrobium sp. LC103]|uniref:ABC transporter substrate-binding protein n=1 Tax=Aquamicrobium sp. LC103 TaxID=1120658 RepID=UPI00063E7E04|nr:ABC transporter substrate-binding protein [Aquamicrobium sp. LC103]TKT78295.1 polyamine ABC transporter substrate-binding protein [Aquamicrobium sp. LC103]
MKIKIIALLLGLSASLLATASHAETLQVAVGTSDITNIDPHRANGFDSMLLSNVFDGLVRFPPGSADPARLEPDLAESWEISEDGKSWTFHLRSGVQFHGGYGELTADDVVYSLKRASDPATSSFAGNFSSIADVAKVDDKTVRIDLKYADGGLLGLLSNFHGGLIVSKKAAEEMGSGFASKPIGTGPYAIAEHMPQQHVKLVAHQDYFRGKPEIDEVLWRFVLSDSSRDLAFQSGQIDMIYGKREQRWVEQVKERADTKVDVFGLGEFRTLHINKSIKPLDDIRVRQAIAAAIDIDQIVRFVGSDIARKGCSVVPPGYLGESCSWTIEHDVEKAKTLLAEAGHGDGLTLPVVVSNISSQLPIMEIIQSQLAKAGISLDMKVVDHPTYQQLIRQNASALVFYGAARFPVADTYLSEFYHSNAIVGQPNAITNFSHCSAGDADIEAARTQTDEDQRLASWKAAQEKISEDVCSVPLFELLQVWARSAAVDLGYDLKGAINIAPQITEKSRVNR